MEDLKKKLKEVLQDVQQELRLREVEVTTFDEARSFIQGVLSMEDVLPRDMLKAAVEDLALEHKIWVEVGDYGNGEHLVLDNSNYYGYSPGDWVSSSETC